MSRLIRLLTVVAALLGGARGALSNGGDSHPKANEPPKAGSAPAGEVRLPLEGEKLEGVLVYRESDDSKRAMFTLYLSDWETNRPITGARAEIDLSGARSLNAPFQETKSVGTYELATDALPTGNYSGTVVAEVGESVELLTIENFNLGVVGSESSSPKTILTAGHTIALGTLVIVVVLAGIIVRRRNKK